MVQQRVSNLVVDTSIRDMVQTHVIKDLENILVYNWCTTKEKN
jgi:hypothetical protein